MSLDTRSPSGGLANSRLVGRAIKYAGYYVEPREGGKEWNLVLACVIHAYWFAAGMIDARIKMT